MLRRFGAMTLTATSSGLRLDVLMAGVLCLQDAKGKIRVYCRVRPMLEFEKSKRQVS
jgi:hypothetical protein